MDINVSEYEDLISNNNKSETIFDEKVSGIFWTVFDILYLSYCDSRKVHSASVMPVSRAGLGSPFHPALPFGLGVWPECADLLAW